MLDKQYSSYDAYSDIDNPMELRDLQPGIPETGNVVYRIPDGNSEFQVGGVISGENKALHTQIKL